MLPSHFCWLALPGQPGSLGDRIIAVLEKSPPRTKGRGMHHYVKNAVASQAVECSPPGQPWGLGHDALISVTFRAVLLKETLCIFWAALLPGTRSIYAPDSHGVNNYIGRDHRIQNFFKCSLAAATNFWRKELRREDFPPSPPFFFVPDFSGAQRRRERRGVSSHGQCFLAASRRIRVARAGPCSGRRRRRRAAPLGSRNSSQPSTDRISSAPMTANS